MVWVSVAWIAYEMYFKVLAPVLACSFIPRSHAPSSADNMRHHQVTDQYNEKWRYDWVTSDFWYVLNFGFLCAICFLFRPSFNSTRYAYSELEGEVPLF